MTLMEARDRLGISDEDIDKLSQLAKEEPEKVEYIQRGMLEEGDDFLFRTAHELAEIYIAKGIKDDPELQPIDTQGLVPEWVSRFASHIPDGVIRVVHVNGAATIVGLLCAAEEMQPVVPPSIMDSVRIYDPFTKSSFKKASKN
jgi:hypothetical protein